MIFSLEVGGSIFSKIEKQFLRENILQVQGALSAALLPFKFYINFKCNWKWFRNKIGQTFSDRIFIIGKMKRCMRFSCSHIFTILESLNKKSPACGPFLRINQNFKSSRRFTFRKAPCSLRSYNKFLLILEAGFFLHVFFTHLMHIFAYYNAKTIKSELLSLQENQHLDSVAKG